MSTEMIIITVVLVVNVVFLKLEVRHLRRRVERLEARR